MMPNVRSRRQTHSKLSQATPPEPFIVMKHIVHDHGAADPGPSRSIDSHTSQSVRPSCTSRWRRAASCQTAFTHVRVRVTKRSHLVSESAAWSQSVPALRCRSVSPPARCGASLQHLPHPQRHPAAAGRSLRGLQRLLQEQEEHHPGRRDPVRGSRWVRNVQN